MKKVTIGYNIRHKTFLKNACFNDSLALFEPDGCFIAVVTCDPDGVYVAGDIALPPYEYVGRGVYQVEIPDEYVVRKVAYAYNTKHGRKFAIPVEHRFSENVFVSMRIGEYLQDKFNDNPIHLYLQTADSGMILDPEKDIIVNDRIDLPLPPYGREVGRVYGVRNPNITRKIYRNAYKKWLIKEKKNTLHYIFYDGQFGLKFNEFGEFFVTYYSYNHPEIVIAKKQNVVEIIDIFNFLASLYYAPSDIVVVKDRDPIILKKDKWITAIDIPQKTIVSFPINDSDALLFYSAEWDESQKELAEKALSLLKEVSGYEIA